MARRPFVHVPARWSAFGLAVAAVLGGAFLALVVLGRPAAAAVTVTPAAGGGSISADTAATGGSGAWTSLGAITIAENLAADFAAGQANFTLILTAPTGFEFNTAQVPDVTGASGDLSNLTMAVPSATTFRLTFITDPVADVVDTVVIGGVTPLQVRPTNATPLATGNITRSSGNPGTAMIAGITADVTNFGTLTMVNGAITRLGITTQPGAATAGAAFGTQPVVRTEDQFGNASTVGLGASLNVTATLTTGTGPLVGTAALDIGTGAGNGTVNYADLQLNAGQVGAVLTFSAAGLTSAVSNAFNVGGGAASGATSTISAAPASRLADGIETATVTVQLKDAGGTDLVVGGDAVVLGTDLGALSLVVDNGNGTYTATLTSNVAGLATISGTVNAGAITDTATVTFTAPAPPPADPPPVGTSTPVATPTASATPAATPVAPPSPLVGAAPTTIDEVGVLVASASITVPEVRVELRTQGCDVAAIAFWDRGVWRVFIFDAPGQVNALFPRLLRIGVPLFVRCR